MIDWTTLTDDPNDGVARREVLRALIARREIRVDCDLTDFVAERVSDKRVLDIGVVSHTMDYVGKAGWRHAIVAQHAAHCVGIDILADEVARLREAGYNVRVADATSDADLGERFDVVFIGDVVEHVDNAVRLLRFAGRHLAAGGVVLVATPNPFSRKFFRQLARDGAMVTNLDHVAWITPSMALELGRRARLQLQRYYLIKRVHGNALVRFARSLARRLTPIELAFPDYLYELGRTDGLVEPQFDLPRGKAIAALHDESIETAGEPVQAPARAGVWTWIDADHRLNVRLAQKQEDLARLADVADDAVVANVRAIDHLEQQRTEAIEQIDQAIVAALDIVTRQPGASQHSETPGAIIDRLSMLAIGMARMERIAARDDASPDYRAGCADRRARLARHRDELAACLDTLLARGARGQAFWRVWPRNELRAETAVDRGPDEASS